MKIPRQIIDTVEAKYVTVHAKVCDRGGYELLAPNGEKIAVRDNYVPTFFPGEHYGDYLILKIDLETGQIVNWRPNIDPIIVAEAFDLLKKD